MAAAVLCTCRSLMNVVLIKAPCNQSLQDSSSFQLVPILMFFFCHLPRTVCAHLGSCVLQARSVGDGRSERAHVVSVEHL